MKHVVSVSLGSSARDKKVHIKLLGEEFVIERRGTDGDLGRAISLLRELDGKVDAVGLGGIDVYLVAGGRRYPVRDGLKMLRALRVTPGCDGSGLKNTLEREVINQLFNQGLLRWGQKILLVSAVDRFGMAEALVASGAQVIFGDLIFALGLPIPLRSLKTVAFLARIILPILGRLPFKILYPTGTKQEKEIPKYNRYYDWAEVIAGDFHFIKRYLPPRIPGKIILTNTTTEHDVELLQARGARLLITTTPEIEGRSFGTNVLEAAFLALLRKKWEEATVEDYLRLIKALDLKPSVTRLNA
ncbi:MAG: quinate 5-dehydrogenase [Bacillota bacterium]